MFKKTILAAAAALSIGGAMTATSADAAPFHGGGYHGGGFHDGWRGGYGWGGPVRFVGPGYWGFYGGCRAYWRWSPAWGRYVRDERCY